MKKTIKLTFNGNTTIEVPLRQTVTRTVLRRCEAPMQAIAAASANTAFVKALEEHPEALTVMLHNGTPNPKWAIEEAARIRQSSPNMEEAQVADMVNKNFIGTMQSAFPAIIKAVNNPVLELPRNDLAVLAEAITIVRVIADTTKLTDAQREQFDTLDDAENGTNLFWDDQDVEEILSAVESFRTLLLQRSK